MSHTHGAGHGQADGGNKYIAIFISILALFLAIAETLAKSAQTNSISSNIEASNLWSFYQAKTIRQTAIKTAVEQLEVDMALAKDAAAREAYDKRIGAWRAEVERYQSEPKPSGGEGRKELQERAKVAEHNRDLFAAKYHHFEIGSALFQISIVLASVYLIVNVIYLLAAAGFLTVLGFFFSVLGLFFPHVHMF